MQGFDEIGVLRSKIGMGEGIGDYVRLGGCAPDPESVDMGSPEKRCPLRMCSLWCWLKVVILAIVVLGVVAAFVIWGGPLLLKKVRLF